LTEKGLDFETINYVENPLSAEEFKRLLHSAGIKPLDAVRTNEPAYREHIAGQNLSDEQLIRIMTRYPELIQRPIVVRGNHAVLARPAEKLADLGIK
jgi:arsenate reductase (glutaredoxin)